MFSNREVLDEAFARYEEVPANVLRDEKAPISSVGGNRIAEQNSKDDCIRLNPHLTADTTSHSVLGAQIFREQASAC